MTSVGWCAIAGAIAVVAARAQASPPRPFPETPAPPGGGAIGALWRTMAAELDLASAAREPPLRPPTARPVKWKARRIASIDLGAPLLALAAGDLDGDRKAELIALTERAVIVLGAQGKGLAERARIELPADPAAIRPRDAVGALAVVETATGAEVLARSSTVGRGARYRWADGALAEVAAIAGYPFCADRELELAAGRNYASADGADLWIVRCRLGGVDAAGLPTRVEAAVTVAGQLALVVETRCDRAPAGCVPLRTAVLDGVGAVIEVDDVDSDGAIEVFIAGAGPPGDRDAVAVYPLGPAGLGKKPAFRRGFSGGVIGLASGDVDGDGDREAFAAVRLAGGRKVDLWLLN